MRVWDLDEWSLRGKRIYEIKDSTTGSTTGCTTDCTTGEVVEETCPGNETVLLGHTDEVQHSTVL